MYLVVKTCIETNYLSCGCLEKDRIYSSNTLKHLLIKSKSSNEDQLIEFNNVNNNSIMNKQEEMSANDFSKLDAGSPIRLSKTAQHRQGKIKFMNISNTMNFV